MSSAGAERNCGTAIALAISAVLSAGRSVQAQSTPGAASGALALEEIIVTATKRSLDVQQVSQSISVLTTADIERDGLREMADYIKALPSVTLAQSQPGRNNVIIRGVSSGTSEYRTDSLVAVYLDEQPMTTANAQVSPYLVDIERIESLPGPQGTLFGSSAPGGALRIITNKPDFNGLSGQMALTGFATQGGDGSYEFDGHLNMPLIDQKLAFRATGFYAHHGGWVDNVLGPDLTPFTTGTNNAAVAKDNFNIWQIRGGRLAALWNASDDVNVLFNATGQWEGTKGSWETDPHLGNDKITKFYDEYRDDNWWQGGMTITADLGFAELKAATSYLSREMNYQWDNMTYEQWKTSYYGGPDAVNLYNTEYTYGTIFNFETQKRLSQEVRLASTSTSRLQWMAGLFYEDVRDDWDYGAQNPHFTHTLAWDAANASAAYYHGLGYDVPASLPPTDITYLQQYRRELKQIAVFGEVSYKLSDAWTVTAGSRWFQYKRSEYEKLQYPFGLPVGLLIGANGVNQSEGTDSAALYKFDVRYRFGDDQLAYFLFSQGYRLGGSNSARAANTGLVPAKYKADHLDNYELGLKSQWWGRRLTMNLSAYLMRWQDRQLEQTGLGPWWLRGHFNGKGADSKGVELNLSALLSRGLQLDIDASAGKSELTAVTTYPDGFAMPSGTSTPYAPRLKYSAGLEYTVGSWQPFGGELWMRFDYSYQAPMYNSLPSASKYSYLRIPAWDFGTVQLGLKMPSSLELTLRVDNLWNERGINSLNSDGEEADQFNDPRFHGTRSLFRPRNIGISIRKSFN